MLGNTTHLNEEEMRDILRRMDVKTKKIMRSDNGYKVSTGDETTRSQLLQMDGAKIGGK